MARGLSQRRFLKVSSPYVNLELGLASLISASLVFLINYWGTGYIAWHASLIRLAISLAYHLFLPKLAEYASGLGKSWFGRQFWGNLLPNTIVFAVQIPLFVWLGLPRPLASVWPFWLVSLVTFTQVIKFSRRGYEAGVFDITGGLWEDCRRLCRRS